VVSVRVDEASNTATVVVPDQQLSLAIGKEGQNARLAAKLTGWRIDIKAESVALQEPELEPEEIAPVFVAPAPEGIEREELERIAAAATVPAPAIEPSIEVETPEELPVAAIEEAPVVVEAPEPEPVPEPAPVAAVAARALARPATPGGLRFAEDLGISPARTLPPPDPRAAARGARGGGGRGRDDREETEAEAAARRARGGGRRRRNEVEEDDDDPYAEYASRFR
jgi:hypothetical protein